MLRGSGRCALGGLGRTERDFVKVRFAGESNLQDRDEGLETLPSHSVEVDVAGAEIGDNQAAGLLRAFGVHSNHALKQRSFALGTGVKHRLESDREVRHTFRRQGCRVNGEELLSRHS